jgi:HK97 gp10 family phage protein
MPSITVTVRGSLTQAAARRAQSLVDAIDDAVVDAAYQIAARAQDEVRAFKNAPAPSRQTTGGASQLQQSIIAERVGVAECVVTPRGTPYARFVEYGTGRRGAAGQSFTGKEVGPLPQGYSHGASPGMAARPYMHPAGQSVAEELRDEVGRILRGGGK